MQRGILVWKSGGLKNRQTRGQAAAPCVIRITFYSGGLLLLGTRWASIYHKSGLWLKQGRHLIVGNYLQTLWTLHPGRLTIEWLLNSGSMEIWPQYFRIFPKTRGTCHLKEFIEWFNLTANNWRITKLVKFVAMSKFKSIHRFYPPSKTKPNQGPFQAFQCEALRGAAE